MRRVALSILSNIAEGRLRKGNKGYIQSLYIPIGSASELDTQLLIAKKLNYINDKKYNILNGQLTEIGKMLNGLINYRKTLSSG